MASLYHIGSATKQQIQKFRISTSRSEKIRFLPIKIEPKPSYEIVIDEESLEELEDAEELSGLTDALPNNCPRFLLLAYPITKKDGIKQVPLVLLYWKPATVVSPEWKMLYAGALEQVRSECAPRQLVEVSSGLEEEEDIEELQKQIEAN
ncbi:hypothetical protein HG535_0B01290 [Zygotorulaspora mrakii]|uniref:ADF-H domain-containing protein n=1 Tax=Zygotorulaspora mrakii TaxID=42260 RepID=A0A7H9AXS2_ZYGMR|nr:uncharacterized protein HG535_0B01290 [Zygotorulaspora mrakii]QLG71091.1 hypothetical protein HG535_0B01290 [Zygotorulaspora mrakii]